MGREGAVPTTGKRPSIDRESSGIEVARHAATKPAQKPWTDGHGGNLLRGDSGTIVDRLVHAMQKTLSRSSTSLVAPSPQSHNSSTSSLVRLKSQLDVDAVDKYHGCSRTYSSSAPPIDAPTPLLMPMSAKSLGELRGRSPGTSFQHLPIRAKSPSSSLLPILRHSTSSPSREFFTPYNDRNSMPRSTSAHAQLIGLMPHHHSHHAANATEPVRGRHVRNKSADVRSHSQPVEQRQFACSKPSGLHSRHKSIDQLRQSMPLFHKSGDQSGQSMPLSQHKSVDQFSQSMPLNQHKQSGSIEHFTRKHRPTRERSRSMDNATLLSTRDTPEVPSRSTHLEMSRFPAVRETTSVNNYKRIRGRSIAASQQLQISGDVKSDGYHQVNQYILLREIGQGSYGTVMLAQNIDDQRYYACKIISKSKLRRKWRLKEIAETRSIKGSMAHKHSQSASANVQTDGLRVPHQIVTAVHEKSPSSAGNPAPYYMQAINREIAILKKLTNHANITSLVEVLDDKREDSIYMVFELCAQGPVINVVPGERVAPLCEESARQYFRDILLGLEFAHSRYIIHRDIKPANVLLTVDGTAQIADFGISHMFSTEALGRGPKSSIPSTRSASPALFRPSNSDDDLLSPISSSPLFSAPEICGTGSIEVHGKALDIWGLGVTLYCFVHGKCPFDTDSPLDAFHQILHVEYVFFVSLHILT